MAAKLQAMDPVDAAWYHMDGATNLAMVTGVVLTGTPLDFERVKAVYAHRLLPIARFRRPFPSCCPARAAHQAGIARPAQRHRQHAARLSPTALAGSCRRLCRRRERRDPPLSPLCRRRYGDDGDRPVTLRRGVRRTARSCAGTAATAAHRLARCAGTACRAIARTVGAGRGQRHQPPLASVPDSQICATGGPERRRRRGYAPQNTGPTVAAQG